MKRLSLLFFALLMCWPVLAQEKSGSQAGPANKLWENADFSFEYPGDWTLDEVDALDGVFFRAPFAGESDPGSGFVISQPDMSVIVNLNQGLDPDAPLFDPQTSDDEMLAFELNFMLNGLEAGSQHLGNEMFRVHTLKLRLDETTQVSVLLSGVSTAQIAAARPLALQLLNSLRLAGDDSPVDPLKVVYDFPEDHVRQGEWGFSHPADWITEEQNSYTLLVPPGLQTTIGLSTPFWRNEAEAADIDAVMDQQVQNIVESLGDTGYELYEVDLKGVRGLRLDIIDEAENFGYTQVMAYTEGNWSHNMTFVGTPGDIALLEDIIPDLLLTLRPVTSSAQ